jgi:hypothetical protein
MAGIYDSATNAVDYQITNLHGDVAATIHGTATGLTTTHINDEFGTPLNPADIGTSRYGWLGAHQRAADTPAGITLMGVRLYNATAADSSASIPLTADQPTTTTTPTKTPSTPSTSTAAAPAAPPWPGSSTPSYPTTRISGTPSLQPSICWSFREPRSGHWPDPSPGRVLRPPAEEATVTSDRHGATK